MSTLTPSNPLKIIGKDFLIDENLLISNYNPYDTRNPSGFDGLSQLRNIQGKLYVLDKTNFKEPTVDEFRGIKTIGGFTTGFKLISGATLNYFSVNLDFTYDKTVEQNPKRLISLVLGSSTLSIIPAISNGQAPDIFLDSFCLLVLDEDGTNTFHKTYVDIPEAEQKFMWLFPSEQIQVKGSDSTDPIDTNKILSFAISNPTNQKESVFDFITSGKLSDTIPGGTIDTSKPYQYNLDTFTDIPDSLTWEQVADLPEASGWSQYVVTKNFVYKFGCYNTVGASAVIGLGILRASLDNNGVPGTWEPMGNAPISFGTILQIKDKLWAIGGTSVGGAPQKISWYTTIKEDGTFEAWAQGPIPGSYPSARSCIVNNRVYVFGGHDGTNYHKYCQIADILPNGMLSDFYYSEVSFPFNMTGATTFAYGNKIFIIPGYNRENSTYTNLIYSCVVNDDGTIQTPKGEKNVGTNGYIHASFILGSKLYLVGGYDTGAPGYTSKIVVADLSVVNGQVQISDFRSASNFPIVKHGDGVFITKNYVYLPAGREGTTWSNSKKLYRANISDYGNGKNDYTKDTYYYKNKIIIPGDQESSTNQSFSGAQLKFQVPYYTNISDALNPVQILNTEILAIAKKLKLNDKYLDHLTLDDLDIPILTQEQIDINGLDTILNITINENSLVKYLQVAPVNPDQYEKNVSLLLNGEVQYDLAGKNFLEYNGNFQSNGINTITKKFGNSSMYFDGTSWIRVLPSSYLIFGSSNFTVEFWINCTLPATGSIVPIGKWGSGANSRSWGIFITANGTLSFGLSTDGATGLYSTSSEAGLIQTNTWAHIALTRNADSIDLWVNGVKTSATYNIGIDALFNASVQTTIGTVNNSTLTDGAYGRMTGYLDGLRITEGVTRYQNNFTPPAEELLLVDYAEMEDTIYVHEPLNDVKSVVTYTFDNTSADLSGNQHGSATAVTYPTDPKFGTNCAQFNGSTSAFVPYNLNPVGDFTVSLWLKISANISNTQNVFMRTGAVATGGDLCGLLLNTSNIPFWQNEYAENTTITASCTKPMQLNKWHHIVITKTGEYLGIYMDGESQGGSYSNNWSIGAAARTANPFKLGTKYISSTGHSPYSHKADQLRIFNGGVDQEQVNVLFSEKRFKAKKLWSNTIPTLEVSTPNTQESLPVNLTELSGFYQLHETFYKYDLAGVPGGTSFFEAQQLAAPQTNGICFSTGKKVYLYGGRNDTSASSTIAPTNTMWVSNILNDGQIEGFTQVGTNTLNYILGATYTYIKPDGSGTGWVYVFGGISGTTGTNTNSNNLIKRAQINVDGSIGTWENHSTMPYSMYNCKVIAHPEDPTKLYLQGGYAASAGVYTYLNTMKIFLFEIDQNGNIKVDNTKTKLLDKLFNSNSMTFLKDPKDGFWYLFIFGTQTTENNNGIFKLKIGKDFRIIGETNLIGKLNYALGSNFIIQDKDNIYIIGGGTNAAGAMYGASGFVLKFSKTDLLNADYWHQAKYTTMPNLTIPVTGSTQIETSYANYLICPYTTTNVTGTVYNWQSTGRILGFRKNYTILGENGLNLDNFNLELTKGLVPTKLVPNKLNARIREELFSSLMVKAQQTLTVYGSAIQFKDPVTDSVITLSELTNAITISDMIAKFIEWVVKLAEDNYLDNFNQYLYTKNGLNTDRSLDIIIPEIIFNIISDRNMFNINKLVFEGYLTTNAPSTYDISIPGDIFDLEDILETLFRSKSESSIITPATYGSGGLQLPNHNKFGFSKRQNEVKYMFIPQRTSQKEVKIGTLPPRPRSSTYIDSIGSCNYKNKIPLESVDYKDTIVSLLTNAYFVGVNGNNSNDGLTPENPKADLTGCPAGSTVYLLPGTYTGEVWRANVGGGNIVYVPTVLNGFNGHNIYGFGTNKVTIEAGGWIRCILFNPSSGSIHNVKFIWTGIKNFSNAGLAWITSYIAFHGLAANRVFQFYNCHFQNLYSYNPAGTESSNNIDKVYLNNCSESGSGNYVSSYYTNAWVSRTVANNEIDTKILNAEVSAETFKTKDFVDNIKASYKFTPAYTLIPISDDSSPEDNSIILEINQNFTNIPNLSYKL